MAEKKFGKRTFRTGRVLASEAVLLQARLLGIVGGGVDRLPAVLAGVGEDKSEELKAASNAALVGALADMFGKAQPRVVQQLIADVINMAEVKSASGDYQQSDIDQDFSDNPGDLYPVVGWVLKEVLGDFFSGVLQNGVVQKALKDFQ